MYIKFVQKPVKQFILKFNPYPLIMRITGFLLLAITCLANAGENVQKNRVLVLYDNSVILTTHSIFLKDLTSNLNDLKFQEILSFL